MDLIWRSQKLSIILSLLVFTNAYAAKKQQDKVMPIELNRWEPLDHPAKRGTQPLPVMVPVQSKSEGASLTVNVFGQPKFFVFMGKKNRLPITQHRYSHPPNDDEDSEPQSAEPYYTDDREYRRIKGVL